MSYDLRSKSKLQQTEIGRGAPDCNGSGNNPPSVNQGTAKSKSANSAASSNSRKLIAEHKLAKKLAEIEKERLKMEQQSMLLELRHEEEEAKRELALEMSRIEDEEYVQSADEYDEQRVSDWANKSNPEFLSPPPPSVKKQTDSTSYPNNVTFEQLTVTMNQIAISNQQLLKCTETLVSSKIHDDEIARQLTARQSTPRELPTFSGNAEDWPLFINQYYSTTKTCNYTAEENVIRLRKSLTGNAKSAVHGLLIAPDKADDIIEILQLRFGQSHQIINSLIDKVKAIPSQKPGKPHNIIHMASKIQNLVQIIKSLNCTAHLSNPILINELTDKLLDFHKFNWSKTASQLKCYSLEDFSKWLMEEANAICHLSSVNHLSPVNHYSNSKMRPDNKNQGIHKQTVLTTTTSSQVKVNSCPICKQSHRIWACEDFKKKSNIDKWNFIKEVNLCLNCLSKGHQVRNCSSKINCRVFGCNKRHHTSIHEFCNSQQSNHISRNETSAQVKPSEIATPNTVAFSNYKTNKVLLRILPVKITGPKGEVATYALLDDASTVTLIEEKIADKIGAKGNKETLHITWTNNEQQSDLHSRRVCLEIRGESGERFKLTNVRTTHVLNLPLQSYNINSLKKKWQHLKNAPIPFSNETRPSILIGQDNCHLLLPQEIISDPPHAPVLTLTKLGWSLHGNMESDCNTNFTLHVTHQEDNDEELHKLVKKSFSTKEFGVTISTKLPVNPDDERAISIINETANRIGDRWEVGLLWKKNLPILPDTYDFALQRLLSIEKKMDKNPEFGSKYNEKIQDFISKNYARKVPLEELSSVTRKFYLPHFGVQNPNKPGKIRPVFDAAAKCKGLSLNDMLLKGPDILNSLPGIIMRFRQREIGFTADIKEMFPQVKIIQKDQYAQLFLWRGWRRDGNPDTYAMSSMTFGAKSSPYTAQEIKNRNAQEFENEFPEASHAIINKFYMDDYLDSTHENDEAIKLIHDVILILQRGGFQLCNWVTNSKEVRKSIPAGLRAATKEFTEFGESERVLGLLWNPEKDLFGFSLKFHKINPAILNGEQQPTKRTYLKVLMSLFDPLGFICHITIKGKILLQDIWQSGISWDEVLPEKLLKKWETWRKTINKLTELFIPRCYSLYMKNALDIQLHIFTDASVRAFAAAAYLRIDCGNKVDVCLIMGRTRVAPLKFLSIPRLELQAAVMGTRLATTVRKELELPFSSTHFCTDSLTVLSWIKSSERKYKIFVAHRLGEILDSTETNQWRWVPTKDNVADDATRDSDIPNITSTARWIIGPHFLRLSSDNWPKEKTQTTTNLESVQEEEIICNINEQPNNFLQRFSSWKKLIRITAWCQRFIKQTRIHSTNRCRSPKMRRTTECRTEFGKNCPRRMFSRRNYSTQTRQNHFKYQ